MQRTKEIATNRKRMRIFLKVKSRGTCSSRTSQTAEQQNNENAPSVNKSNDESTITTRIPSKVH
jgi:hypothetical protein